MTKIIPIKMKWEYDDNAYITSLEELEAKVAELENEALRKGFPFIVEFLLDDGSGDGLYINIGHDYSILQYVSACTHSVIRSALGNPEDEDIYIPISFMGSYSEPSRSKMIPNKKALAALIDYIINKRIPDEIQFE